MANFTIELGELAEMYGCSIDVVEGRTILTNAERLGLAHYPIFDEGYRETLNGMIIDRYLNREIGFETGSFFVKALRSRLNETMPYYNKLYKSNLIEFDPLSTVDVTSVNISDQEQKTKSDAKQNANSKVESGSKNISSDYPQSQLRDGDYATSGAQAKAETDSSSDSTASEAASVEGSSKSTSTQKGYSGSASSLLAAYRETLINVDLMVIDSLSDLFMQVTDIPQSYTNSQTINYFTRGM